MIAFLKGVLIEKSANRIVLDVGGVGYEVQIPVSTYYELGDPGESASLRIYTHVREDALALFGFLDSREKLLFTQLIQISGIGPKLGVTILSGLPPDEFVEAIRDGDLARLNGIPGVGKKTAERLILEMRDKLLDWGGERLGEALPDSAGKVKADVISALVNLGYSRKEAEKRMGHAQKEVGSDRFELLLKTALK